MKIDYGVERARHAVNHLDLQKTFWATFLKQEYRLDAFDAIVGWLVMILSSVLFVRNNFTVIQPLLSMWLKLVSFSFNDVVQNFSCVSRIDIEVHVSLGIKRPIQKLQRI